MPISYGQWQSYPWKNELAMQSQRVAIHFAEMLRDDFDGEHSPLDMLDRAIVLSAFAMRRMFEKRLVTDKLASEKISTRTFPALAFERVPTAPTRSYSGGWAFENYSFETVSTKLLTISDVANEIIHSSQLIAKRKYQRDNPDRTVYRVRLASENPATAFHDRGILLHG